MAIGMGECREKVRSMMIEVCYGVCYNVITGIMWTNMVIENDTACWKAAGGTGLIVEVGHVMQQVAIDYQESTLEQVHIMRGSADRIILML
jgi:hypothetical protein